MKKPIKPLTHPLNIEITPRLLAAVEASAGRKVPPGAKIMLMPAPIPFTGIHHDNMPLPTTEHPPKHPGETCHLCGAKDYACPHIPGVPF